MNNAREKATVLWFATYICISQQLKIVQNTRMVRLDEERLLRIYVLHSCSFISEFSDIKDQKAAIISRNLKTTHLHFVDNKSNIESVSKNKR